MAVREDLRNVAIVAHVDHGKTTLVDEMLWQTGAFRANQDVDERVMDSMDLEREKGITILAKNTSVTYGDVKINIIDTPGHADFGGEVERGPVDGRRRAPAGGRVEGPLPQTRFVLRKALEADLPVVLVVNKVDRPDARIAEVVHEVEELFLDLDADLHQLDFPIVYCVSREGKASLERPADGAGLPDGATLTPLLDLLLERIPAPHLRPRRAAAGARHQPRLVALRRSPRAVPGGERHPAQGPHRGLVPQRRHHRAGQAHRALRHRGARAGRGRRGRPRRDHRHRRHPGDHHRRDAHRSRGPAAAARHPHRRPQPLDDDRHQHLAAGRKEGAQLTARLVKGRLDRELVGNVSIRVLPTERPDTWEVQGRGELQLAVLVEIMRREGFEPTVGKPQVLTKEIDGKVHEPVDRLTIDVPEDYLGVVTQLLALRKGRMEQIINHGTGWVRMEYLVPAHGLIGFRTEFITETRGTGLLHHVFEEHGAVGRRDQGSTRTARWWPIASARPRASPSPRCRIAA